MPVDLLPATRDDWRNPQVSQPFVQAFTTAFRGKTVRCRFVIARVFPPSQGSQYTAFWSEPLRVGRTKLTLQMMVPDSDPLLPKLMPGTTCSIFGQVYSQAWGAGGLQIGFRQPVITLSQ